MKTIYNQIFEMKVADKNTKFGCW